MSLRHNSDHPASSKDAKPSHLDELDDDVVAMRRNPDPAEVLASKTSEQESREDKSQALEPRAKQLARSRENSQRIPKGLKLYTLESLGGSVSQLRMCSHRMNGRSAELYNVL